MGGVGFLPLDEESRQNNATAPFEIFNFAITFAPGFANICLIAINFALAWTIYLRECH